MTAYFLLFLILHAGPGDTVRLGGTHEYVSLEACTNDAHRMMNWLTQPGVTVEGQCHRHFKRATTHDDIG
jgi:hypothetical protein